MARFQKLIAAIDRIEAHWDRLEADGVDITKRASGKRNLVAECLETSRRNFEKKRAKAAAQTAASWSVGDVATTRRGETGTVTAIDGSTLVLDIAGAHRKFAASLVAKSA